MPVAVIFLISLTANVLSGFLKKGMLSRYGSGKGRHQLFNGITSLVAVLALLVLGFPKSISPFTLGLGVLFGVVTAVQNLATLQALDVGPLSYTTVLINLSTLIPTLSGYFIWSEPISPVQIAGIGLLVVCFALSVEGGDGQKKTSLRWLLWTLLAFVCTGAIGVMQKWHQSTDYKGELDGFLVVALGISTLYSAAMLLILKGRKSCESQCKHYAGWKPLLIMAVFGICVALNNKLNLLLSGAMDAAIFYPVMNGGGLIATNVSACLLLRERLTKRRWIGMAVGIVAVILLCDPFR